MIKLLVIYTGGTFGMSPGGIAPEKGTSKEEAPMALLPMSLENLKARLPPCPFSDTKVSIEQYAQLLDSSSITPTDWSELAELIAARSQSCDGFVVIHGTDTMAYTATMLSFMLQGLTKPVVVTGAQHPLIQPRTDAVSNYLAAITYARALCLAQQRIDGVAIAFGGKLLRGCRATKVSTHALTAFASPNAPELGWITQDGGVTLNTSSWATPKSVPEPKFKLRSHLSSDVFALKLFPGISVNHLRATLKFQGLKAIIIESYGAGNMPTDAAFIDVLKTAARHVHLVAVSQCLEGAAGGTDYLSNHISDDIGLIQGGDMTFEAALCKAMLILGEQPALEQHAFRDAMRTAICGEISAPHL